MTVPVIEQEVVCAPVDKRAISAPEVLNEAFHYTRPSSFSRGMRIDLNGLIILLISGTASVDLPQRGFGQAIVAGGEAHCASVEVPPHLDRRIPKRLSDGLGALGGRARLN